MTEFERILKKKKWTGRDFGRLILLQEALKMKYKSGEIDSPPPEIPMVFIDEAATTESGNFIALSRFLSRYFDIAQMQHQQAQFRFMMLYNHVSISSRCENFLRYWSMLPDIMTVKEYEQAKEKGLDSQMTAPDGTPRMATLLEIVEMWTAHHVRRISDGGDAQACFTELKSEPVEGKILQALKDAGREGCHTKWEALASGDLFSLLPPAGERATDSAAVFLATFPKVADAAVRAIDDFSQANPRASSLAPDKWSDGFLSYRALYEGDFPGCREVMNSPSRLFGNSERVMRNGVAVIQPWHMLPGRVDAEGKWVAPYIGETLMVGPLDEMLPSREGSKEVRERVKASWCLLKKSFCYVRGFAAFVDIVADAFNVDDVRVYSRICDKNLLYKRIQTLNESSKILLEETIYNNGHVLKDIEQDMKVDVVKDVFPQMEVELDLPEKDIKAAARIVKKFDFIDGGDDYTKFINLLFKGSVLERRCAR